MSIQVSHSTNGPFTTLLTGQLAWEGAGAHSITGFKPDAFSSFTNVTGQALSSVITSDSITLTASDNSSAAADRVFGLCVRGDGNPQIELNGDGVWMTGHLARVGDTVRIRLTSSGTVNTASVATLYGDGRSTAWSVTTTTFDLPITNQWKLAEAAGANNALDSYGSDTLTQHGSPGSGTGKVGNCRTFNGTSQWFEKNATDGLAGKNIDFSFSVWFSTNTGSGTRQIISCREAGSGTGLVGYILRQEGTALKLYVGDGVTVNNFEAIVIDTISTGTLYHFAGACNHTSKEFRYKWNGAAVATHTFTYVPSGSSGNKFALGGETAELWSGSIDAVQFNAGLMWSDTQLANAWNSGNGYEA